MNRPIPLSSKEAAKLGLGKKRSKYNAVKTVVDGLKFDSAKEAKRYSHLKLMEKVKIITGLTLQPTFEFRVKGVKVLTYRADFQYLDHRNQLVTEDVKGFKTPVYRLKKKIIEAEFGIKITEI